MTENDYKIQPTLYKPISPVTHIRKNKRVIQAINVCLLVVWLAMAYGLIYKPITSDGTANKKLEDKVVNEPIAQSDKSAVSLNGKSLTVDPESTTKTVTAVSDTYAEVLTQNRVVNFPFYSKLPYQAEKFYIDFPSDSGTLHIFISKKDGKQLALNWLKSNGADVTALNINWITK